MQIHEDPNLFHTGAGNTLAVIPDPADYPGDTESVSIPNALPDPDSVDETDTVGIAFPFYFLGMPDIVKDFVQKIRFSGTPYGEGLYSLMPSDNSYLFR